MTRINDVTEDENMEILANSLLGSLSLYTEQTSEDNSFFLLSVSFVLLA